MARVNLIQLRGGTAAAWTSANPVLELREPGVETDTRRFKFGDGVTAWNSLPYASADSHFLGVYVDEAALTTAHADAEEGDYAYVDAGVGTPVEMWIWDDDDEEWIQSGSPAGGVWGSITGTLSSQTDLQTALNAKLGATGNDRALSATHTLDATDLASVNAGNQHTLRVSVAIAGDVNIPLNATQAFPIGRTLAIEQTGVGQITIVPAGGVTLRSANNANKTYAQYSVVYLKKLATDEWILTGDVTV